MQKNITHIYWAYLNKLNLWRFKNRHLKLCKIELSSIWLHDYIETQSSELLLFPRNKNNSLKMYFPH